MDAISSDTKQRHESTADGMCSLPVYLMLYLKNDITFAAVTRNQCERFAYFACIAFLAAAGTGSLFWFELVPENLARQVSGRFALATTAAIATT